MSDEPHVTASSGYALGRLTEALEAADRHADPELRRRAVAKVERWRAVIEGMHGGRLAVGSRTPVADTPAWVTLEVAHGGFATGRYLAEGPLLPHEAARLAGLPPEVPGATERERLNGWYLGDAGQDALARALHEGRLHVAVPEEGALPVVTWLLAHGHAHAALELVDTLRPWMHRLRFYPELRAVPRPSGALVRVVTVGEASEALRDVRPQARVQAMNEALRVWNPLYDRLVALWLRTVDEPPRLAVDEHGAWEDEVEWRWRSKGTAEGFARQCKRRAREAGDEAGHSSGVAANGAILEQSQILTTHNLAVLTRGLGLEDALRRLAPGLVDACLRFVVRRQQQHAPRFKARLQMLKNTAYAWRQAIFFLSLCDEATQGQLAQAFESQVQKQPAAWAERFAPVVAGLRLVLAGGRFDADGYGRGRRLTKRFLGWSVGHHWLMPSTPVR